MSQIDTTFVDRTIERLGKGREKLIAILQAIQGNYNWLPPEALHRVCEISEITPADITGVSTFYDQFRHKPAGDHIIHVCVGTACHVKGAQLVLDALNRHLDIPIGADTDPQKRFTVQPVQCMGCCTLAPVARIDEITYGHLAPDTVGNMVTDFVRRMASGDKAKKSLAPAAGGEGWAEVRIGMGSCCQAGGSSKVQQALQDALDETHAPATVKRVGCVGMCHRTPLVEVVKPNQPPVLYSKVEPEDARKIVLKHFQPRGLLHRIGAKASGLLDNLLTDEAWEPIERYTLEPRDPQVSAFLSPQIHIASESCGVMDPTDMDEYVRRGGFVALKKALAMKPEQIIDEVIRSGVRGRGGAGFPTGQKWKIVRNVPGDFKYIVCNGDEGDPGAFMDRMLFESYPFRIVEGMIIAAYAVGAREGYFYIRAEYPLAVIRIREAVARLEKEGMLGENILGSGVSLKLRIMEGAGAFVCGEETALLASIEGRRGMPRIRPPFPAESGLWDKPTLVNNAETFSLIPWVIRNGADAFAANGTQRSKGTKVFALAGKIRHGGLIEVPMGMTLRQVVEEVGGGIAGGKKFKAVQVGGPSGGCVPAAMADTAVDYEALTGVGAMMGSGGLVVLDEDDCMVDIARYFLSFTQDQSCGRCTFCRVGTYHLLNILNRLCEGKGEKGDIERLEELSITVKKGSLCGLGKTAPNPVLSTIKYFREEYEAHIEKRCPTGRCKALVDYTINDDCIGCTLCAQECPTNAIAFAPHEKHAVDMSKCVCCGTCKVVCPVNAVEIKSPRNAEQVVSAQG